MNLMKILSYRTTLPFDNRGPGGQSVLSPSTQKSVLPTNNVTTIQDVLDGRKSIKDLYPGTRGNWAPGEDVEKNYKDEGDDYKRIERDEHILRDMFDRFEKEPQKWKVKVPGGSKSFVSFELAQHYIRKNNIPFKFVSRVAQKSQEETSRISLISDSLNKVFLV